MTCTFPGSLKAYVGVCWYSECGLTLVTLDVLIGLSCILHIGSKQAGVLPTNQTSVNYTSLPYKDIKWQTNGAWPSMYSLAERPCPPVATQLQTYQPCMVYSLAERPCPPVAIQLQTYQPCMVYSLAEMPCPPVTTQLQTYQPCMVYSLAGRPCPLVAAQSHICNGL